MFFEPLNLAFLNFLFGSGQPRHSLFLNFLKDLAILLRALDPPSSTLVATLNGPLSDEDDSNSDPFPPVRVTITIRMHLRSSRIGVPCWHSVLSSPFSCRARAS
jgi:hypothetical protein